MNAEIEVGWLNADAPAIEFLPLDRGSTRLCINGRISPVINSMIRDARVSLEELTDRLHCQTASAGSMTILLCSCSRGVGCTSLAVAWAAIALAQLYGRTGSSKYLDGALWAANFIETTTRDNINVTPGGYYFGNGQTNKSTEHNIDVYALYTMLARLSGNNFWLDGAQHALAFVHAMFDPPSGHFWTGTSDPTQIFFNNSPEDVQTWSYLAFQDPNYAVSIDWVKTNLATTDTTFAFNNGWDTNTGLRLRVSGMTYASLSKLGTVLGDNTVDADAVWIEGTGHLIAALMLRGLPPGKDIPSFHGDKDLASTLAENVQVAQNSLGAGQTVNGQALVLGQGLTASTSILNTGFGFNYFPYLHIGATSWYVMGTQGENPLQLL